MFYTVFQVGRVELVKVAAVLSEKPTYACSYKRPLQSYTTEEGIGHYKPVATVAT